jgi:hypothetical protein
MTTPAVGALALILLAGCSPATWSLETWGEEFIEEGIPAADFEDDCSVVFDHFLIAVSDPALVGGAGSPVSELPSHTVWDVARPGPHVIGTSQVPATTYSRVDVTVGPAVAGSVSGNTSDEELTLMADGPWSVHVAGELTCGASTVAFAWGFDTSTTYLCEPEFTLASGGAASTQFTVHGDHLFYAGLEDPEASVRGQALLDADDGDGDLTLTELRSVSLAALGDYDVGGASDVEDLAAFVEFLTTTIGHVDGEGHCGVAP